MKRAKPIAPADTKAAQLAADIADKAVRESGRVRLNFRRGDQWCVLHFPQGTDLWTILGECDKWANSGKAASRPA